MSRFILNAIDNHSHLGLNIISAHKLLNRMYVCICNAITDKQIRHAAESGVTSLWELQKQLGVASNCGKCRSTAVDILREHTPDQSSTQRSKQRASSV